MATFHFVEAIFGALGRSGVKEKVAFRYKVEVPETVQNSGLLT